MIDEYEVDTTGTEEEAIEREWKRAQARQLVSLWHVVAPLVRTVVALVVAMGAKSVREALSKAKGWTAPVDVEAEVERAANEIREGREALPDRPMTDVIRPLVTDRARLAREVERLGAEIESLTRGVTHHMTVAAIHRAEIARLTVARDNLQAEVSMLVGGLNDIFGEGAHPAPREALEQVSGLVRRLRAAAPGEAWERARSAMICAMNGASLAHAALVTAWQRYDQTPRAPAAVEPRGDAGTADPDAPTVSIDAITHDFRPGAQDGMPSCPDVETLTEDEKREAHWFGKVTGIGFARGQEAIAETKAKRTAEAREIIASAPVRIAPRWPLCVDCSTDDDTQHIHTEARPTERCARCGNGGIMYAPPEVRAEQIARAAADLCPGCFTGGEDAHPRSERCSGARPEAPEMAVTTGEEQWTPKPGARTMTAPFVVQPERRAAAGEIIRQCGERDFVVMHDDGTQPHYDADELGPEPAAVAPPKRPLVDPLCKCGAPLSEHAIADQYDGGCFRTGCRMFDDRQAGGPSLTGPAGLDLAGKAGGGQ